jgi:hypothetical protein
VAKDNTFYVKSREFEIRMESPKKKVSSVGDATQVAVMGSGVLHTSNKFMEWNVIHTFVKCLPRNLSNQYFLGSFLCGVVQFFHFDMFDHQLTILI